MWPFKKEIVQTPSPYDKYNVVIKLRNSEQLVLNTYDAKEVIASLADAIGRGNKVYVESTFVIRLDDVIAVTRQLRWPL